MTCADDRFPVLHGGYGGDKRLTVPLALVLEHERQADRNHGQTVARLKERGGLAWCELSAVLDDRRWEKMDIDAAHERAMRKVLLWQDRQRKQAALIASEQPGRSEATAQNTTANSEGGG